MTTQVLRNNSRSEYTLDNDWTLARERLTALEARHDPGTFRYLESLNVGVGWHCLEVGGGGGSVTEWLCQRVGPTGRVVATDINTRFLDTLDFPNLEVRVHNIVDDELEQAAFDLVHTRAVLFHIPERQKALERLVSTLKPGGVLLVEEPDYSTWAADPRVGESACDLFKRAHRIAMSASTADLFYGKRLYADVCALGLDEVGAEGRVAMGRGGSVYAEFQRLTTMQVSDRLLETSKFTRAELDTYLSLFDDASFVWMGAVLMAVWGRRAHTHAQRFPRPHDT